MQRLCWAAVQCAPQIVESFVPFPVGRVSDGVASYKSSTNLIFFFSFFSNALKEQVHLCLRRMLSESRRRWITAASDPRSAAQWAFEQHSRCGTPNSLVNSLASNSNFVQEIAGSISRESYSQAIHSRISIESRRSASLTRRTGCKERSRPESSFDLDPYDIALQSNEDSLAPKVSSSRFRISEPPDRHSAFQPAGQRRSRPESTFEMDMCDSSQTAATQRHYCRSQSPERRNISQPARQRPSGQDLCLSWGLCQSSAVCIEEAIEPMSPISRSVSSSESRHADQKLGGVDLSASENQQQSRYNSSLEHWTREKQLVERERQMGSISVQSNISTLSCDSPSFRMASSSSLAPESRKLQRGRGLAGHSF